MIIVLVEWPRVTNSPRANQEWCLFEDDEVNQAEEQYEYWRTHPNSLVTHFFNTGADDEDTE